MFGGYKNRISELPSNRLVSPLIVLVSILMVSLSQTCGALPDSNLDDKPSNTPAQLTTSSDAPTAPGTDVTTASSAVSVTKDIVYAMTLTEDGSADTPWELDLYAPNGVAERPVIVLLHGYRVSKESYAGWSEAIAESGALVYTINAPVRSTNVMSFENGKGFREISEVLACAVGYARATAADLGGDSDNVVLVAHSWGTLYAAWFALGSDSLAANWEEYAATHNGPPAQVDCGLDSVSAQVEGFVGIGGGRYADVESNQLQDRYPDLLQIVSPYFYFGQNTDLPLRLLHGKRDGTARPESSRAFNEVLLDAGYHSQLILFDGGHIIPPQLTFETIMQLTGN